MLQSSAKSFETCIILTAAAVAVSTEIASECHTAIHSVELHDSTATALSPALGSPSLARLPSVRRGVAFDRPVDTLYAAFGTVLSV